jgi:hypothetical protein
METTHQGNFQASGSSYTRTAAVQCFDCHDYTPGQTATTGLSHIVDDLDGTPGTAPKAARGGADAPELAPVAAHERR